MAIRYSHRYRPCYSHRKCPMHARMSRSRTDGDSSRQKASRDNYLNVDDNKLLSAAVKSA